MTGKQHIKKMNKMNDYEKLKYLINLKDNNELNEEFQIFVDNDEVIIHFGYDENDDSVNISFYDNGYHLLPMLFNLIGLKSDFV